MSALGSVALDLARKGFFVFPLRPGTKEPATGKGGFHHATTDESQILKWWDAAPAANIGVACGASGINVLDIDAKTGADPKETIEQLDLDGHAIVWTGEAPERCEQHPDSLAGERGAQIYFAGERRTASRTTIKGVELRGAGAYVAAPPSAHPSGVQYLGELPPVGELPALPASVLEILPAQRTPRERTPTTEWLSILQGISAGERNSQIARIAGHLLRRYIDPDLAAELLHLINEHRCRPPLAAAEVDAVFESICRAELRRRSR